ncbi:aminotransferase class I/II-fold pyridoxal phosphate-dependent enzyme [Azotobacter chroococcum]|uniref:Aminotransferase class I/II-fold pyridoxal phosphate-dependent enzyme n=1 Tax=Azotobacter chroococcum TaxID=353 RepID=A0AA43Z9J6_9GAMM|nr:aminotransferase class I/II-fold pyridoxal phosphate-dependent enzyme [Azotobacter chroococcum]NHN79453.1 aminotransferase class I/II-fold pyridoxal phosphate-dependent enzyme [Azotobacter chroococcum]
MALFDRFAKLAQARADLVQGRLNPFGTCIDEILSPTEGRIGEHRVILAGTNNYLGLTFEPACIHAAQQALEQQGTGTTGSRMANGSYGSHLALETELADFFGRRSVLVFSTGYMVNLGVIAALAGPDDIVLLDADCHASIYDACKLGGAQVIRFRHNDAADLERRMRRLGERARNALILVEGIYSMLGDQAPLREIVEIKQRLGGYLLVDEAHSVGVLGAHGRGLAEELGVEAEVDIVTGTFSKSLGAIGGFAASHHQDMDLLRYASRPYIFTASPSPSAIASVRAALQTMRDRPELRERLWSNARQLYQGLDALGYRLGPQPSPIVPVLLGSPEEGVAFWESLVERGVYVNLVPPLATPGGQALVRCSVSAAHTPEQIERIVEAFAALRAPAAKALAGA